MIGALRVNVLTSHTSISFWLTVSPMILMSDNSVSLLCLVTISVAYLITHVAYFVMHVQNFMAYLAWLVQQFMAYLAMLIHDVPRTSSWFNVSIA